MAKKFSDVLRDRDEERKASAQENLATAILRLDEGKKDHLRAIKEIDDLRAEIVAAGDNLDTLTSLKTVRDLYDRSRKIGGSA